MAIEVSVVRVFTDADGRFGNPLGIVAADDVDEADRQQFAEAAALLQEATQILEARASSLMPQNEQEQDLLCSAVSEHGVAVWQAGDAARAGDGLGTEILFF